MCPVWYSPMWGVRSLAGHTADLGRLQPDQVSVRYNLNEAVLQGGGHGCPTPRPKAGWEEGLVGLMTRAGVGGGAPWAGSHQLVPRRGWTGPTCPHTSNSKEKEKNIT